MSPALLSFVRSDRVASVAVILLSGLVVVSGCREDRSPSPLRRPVAEREYREVEALEWRARSEQSELAAYLGSPWPRVRARAAVAYSRTHGGGDPRPLLQRWEVEEDSTVRTEIVFALRGFERSAVIETLEKASEDEDAAVRRAVATALREVSDSRDLGQKLARDDDPEVRRSAVLSLVLGGQSDPGFWSDRLLKERDESVRWALFAGASLEATLAQALERDLVRAIADRNFLVGMFALEALARFQPPGDAAGESSRGLAATLTVAANTDAFWIQREAAVRSLGTRLLHDRHLAVEDRRRIESLLLELFEGDGPARQLPVFRYRLARSLCALTGPTIVPRLRELAAGPDAGIRAAVAHGLDDVGGSGLRLDASLRELLDALRADDDEEVRGAVARATEEGGGPAAWALADRSPAVRRAALDAAAVLTPSVIDAALGDPDPRVRRGALQRVLQGDLPVDPGLLRSAAADPSLWRWSSRLPAMDLFCARRPSESRALLQSAIEDGSPVVLRHALRLAQRLGIRGLAEERADLVARAALVPGFPLADRDPIERRRRPRVIIGVEGKESFAVELYADETPVHASSFLALARGGYFEGRTVLGVDIASGVRFTPAGSDRHPLTAQPLRPEASLLPFERGSLVSTPVYSHDGERWDAVENWHIALVPRPEWSGWATCWGRVYIGMHVVDRLAPGDRIASIEIVD